MHIAVIGAGAVGGYVGGMLARAGEHVTLIDPWPLHVDRIKADGLRISGTQGEYVVPVSALHISEVQGLLRNPVDIAIIAVKSFNSGWTAGLIKHYLSSTGYVVSMQNSMNDEQIAAVVGWDRTLGCVLNTIGVSMGGPGHVIRHRTPGGGNHAVFRIGEVHGRPTDRAKRLVATLEAVDKAAVISNLWGERWTKLTTNAMQMGILGATGLNNEEVIGEHRTRRLLIAAAAEAIKVGQAYGFALEPIINVPVQCWIEAAQGIVASVERVEQGLYAYLDRQTETGRHGHGSLGRDVLMGRRSEVDAINGLIATKGAEAGVPAPIHAALTDIIKRIERNELTPLPTNIDAICRATGIS